MATTVVGDIHTERQFRTRLNELGRCTWDYQHRCNRKQYHQAEESWQLAEELASTLAGTTVCLSGRLTRRVFEPAGGRGARPRTAVHEIGFTFCSKYTQVDFHLWRDELLAPQFVLGDCHDLASSGLLLFNPFDSGISMVFAG